MSGRMALHEYLGHFVSAAVAADERFVRSRDASAICDGIVVWEQLADSGALADADPGALVDAYLAVSMLYARRHEVLGRSTDLSLALRYLREARRHVEPGSFADLQERMSRAACLLVRFQADGQPEDLDEAITGWTELVDAADAGVAALAAANLGRALLVRHELVGDPEDLRTAAGCSGRRPPGCRATTRRGATWSSPCAPRAEAYPARSRPRSARSFVAPARHVRTP